MKSYAHFFKDLSISRNNFRFSHFGSLLPRSKLINLLKNPSFGSGDVLRYTFEPELFSFSFILSLYKIVLIRVYGYADIRIRLLIDYNLIIIYYR